MKRTVEEPQQSLSNLDERACAFQQCVVFMRQAYPNMAVMTYDTEEHRGAEHLILAKFVIGLSGLGSDEPVWLTYNEVDEATTAGNFPGGLRSSTLTPDGVCLTAEIYPLMTGRDTLAHEGAALIRVRCDAPGTNVWLRFGNGNISFMHYSPNKDLRGDRIDCEEGDTAVCGDGFSAVVTRDGRPITAVVRGNFELAARELAPGHRYAEGRAPGSEGWLLLGFAAEEKRAAELASLDPDAEQQRVEAYYREKFSQWRIHTPSPQLDEAFTHAFLNVEYSWLRPYGWIECIQHWPTMWHMEHTAAEEWAGNHDRVRECLRSQMQNVFPSGAIPDMCTTGKGRRDWGGNNQFFMREVDHYLAMTGDADFAREAEPFMERALRQAFEEYDPACGRRSRSTTRPAAV